MKPGDILLFKAEKDWPSRLIVWGTNSPYAHVAVCASSEMNLAIEAMTRGGVRARDIRQIRQEYDILGVIFLGILKALAKLYFPIKTTANKWQKERDYFCSELCYEAFAIGGGLDIVPDIPQADITSPGDIAKSRIIELVG